MKAQTPPPEVPPSGQPAPPPGRARVRVVSRNYTSWGTRVLAYLIDWAPITIVGLIVEKPFWPSRPPDSWATSDGFTIIAVVVLAAYFFWNLCYRQGKTGQSIGKSALKFKVVGEASGQPIGFWRSFLRQLAHYLDALVCSLGYLWPLWDEKGQTFADKIMATICIPADTADPLGTCGLDSPGVRGA